VRSIRRAMRDLPTAISAGVSLFLVVVSWVLTITSLLPGQKFVGPIAALVCFALLVAAQIRYWGSAPDLELLDLESTDMQVAAKPATYWRVPLTNHGAPEHVTVRLTLIDPNPGIKALGGILHRVGDNPADGVSFGTHYWLGHDETQRYDLVAVIESWVRKYPEIRSTAAMTTTVLSGTGEVTTTSSEDMEQAFFYAFQIIESERHWAQVALSGSYDLTVTAHAGTQSCSRHYEVQADPKTGHLAVF
jgi:hypothetical protein